MVFSHIWTRVWLLYFLTILTFYSPSLKKGGGAKLDLGCLSFHNSASHIYFASAQYFANTFMEFINISYVHFYEHDLAWDCNATFSDIFTRVCLNYTPKFCFRSISWEQIDRFSPKFKYVFILTSSSLVLLHVIFRTYVLVLWPLIYAKSSFPFIILRTNWPIFTKFYICIYIDKIYVEIVEHHGCTFVPELWPLIYSLSSFRSISWEQIDRF